MEELLRAFEIPTNGETGYEFLNNFVRTIEESHMDWTEIASFAQETFGVETVEFAIPILGAAFSGEATIHANVLTDLPGVAYCPEDTATFWIRRRPWA